MKLLVRIAGIVLLVVGIVGAIYGGLTYTEQKHDADLGPLEFSINQGEGDDPHPDVGQRALRRRRRRADLRPAPGAPLSQERAARMSSTTSPSSGNRPSSRLENTSEPSTETSNTPPPDATSSLSTPSASSISAARPAARGR
jgi:hypothetical protein